MSGRLVMQLPSLVAVVALFGVAAFSTPSGEPGSEVVRADSRPDRITTRGSAVGRVRRVSDTFNREAGFRLRVARRYADHVVLMPNLAEGTSRSAHARRRYGEFTISVVTTNNKYRINGLLSDARTGVGSEASRTRTPLVDGVLFGDGAYQDDPAFYKRYGSDLLLKQEARSWRPDERLRRLDAILADLPERR